MNKKERYKLFVEHFKKEQPEPETELYYTNPYELVVAVALSAQCTDKRVNMVTPRFFERFPNPETLATASFEEVFELIRSISYPNNKAKHLIGMAKILSTEFGSVVPSDVDELQKLPGVGRKTANVIASVIFSKPTMAVDTHVFRVSKRLGLVAEKATTPLAVEKELVKNLPNEVIHNAHHWLILHGRYVCVARKPMCDQCQISHFCKTFEKKQNSENKS